MKDLKFEKPGAVEQISDDKNTAKFVIKPLERGYGITLGNALRRVLLSSLPGAAIVSVQIDGVEHEFTTIDGVYEDVMQIILNLKKIVFKVDSVDPQFEQELELNVKGPGTVTASAFRTVNGVEVVNPDQKIATISESINFRMFVIIRCGTGYVSAESNKKYTKYTTGAIAIDSIFTPIVRSTYAVEKARGDQDELTIEIETNGAIEAKEALATASKMLVDCLNVIVEISEQASETDYIYEKVEEPNGKKHDLSIDKLDLSVRLYNSLKRTGIQTVGDLIKFPEEQVMRFRSLGRKSFKELKEKLAEEGLSFAQSIDDEYDADFKDKEQYNGL